MSERLRAVAVPSDTDPDVTGDATLQTEVLDEMSSATNYRRWLVELMAPYLGTSPLEIGSGNGDYADEWARLGIRMTASEAQPVLVDRLRERFPAGSGVSVRRLVAPVVEPADYSAVVAVNVLEHIPDDAAALRSFANLLAPGGQVVLFVPAFQLLMSDYDRAVGHQRRYRRRSLERMVREVGLEPVHSSYVNVIGFFAWLVAMRLLHGRPGEGFALTVFDNVVVPLMRRVERWVRVPFGQSILLVARVPASAR